MSVKEISGYFTEEEKLFDAIKSLRDKNIKIKDVFTPFPVHGLEKALGYKRSLLPKAALIGGLIGGTSGFLFQTWVFTRAYPMNIGGKPSFSVPSFIPVTFECAILFAAFSIVFAFFIKSKLGFGATPKIYDEKATDNRFVVVLNTSGNSDEVENIKKHFESTGVSDIKLHD